MNNKYTRKVLLSLGMGLLGSIAATAQQKIGNNPGTLNPGAVLELESTNRGFLLPRISLTSLSTWGLNGAGTDGMMVFNTNATTGAGYYVWSNGAWNRIFTGTVGAVTTNALAYNATTRILTSTVNGVGASTAALPLAASDATGLLSNTDWATFNAKENALTFANGLTRTSNAVALGGNLTAATTIGLNAFNLTFGGGSATAKVIISGPAGSSTSGLQLSNLLTAVSPTAAAAGQRVLTVDANGNVILGTDFGSNNAGTVTNVTGTAPITVTNGTTAPVIGINQAALDLALMGGILPVTKIASGTAGQTLQMVGTTPTWVTPSVTNTSNIYTADGTLSGARVVTQGTNDLTFGGTGKTIFGSTNASTATNAGRLAAVTNGNAIQLTVMNDAVSAVANTAVIGFRTQGSITSAGLTASIGAEQTGTGLQTDLNFSTYNGTTMASRMKITGAGAVSINGLSGTGSRMVVADAAGVLSTQAIPPISSVTNGNGLTLTSGVLAFTPTANSIPATSITGLDVTAGSNKVTLGGTPAGAALKAFSVDVNEANLSLSAIGGILPVTKIASGTAGQTLQMVGTTPTWVTPSVTNTSNIYTADGTLSGNRVVNLGVNALTFRNNTLRDIQFTKGHNTGTNNMRIMSSDTLEFQISATPHLLTLIGSSATHPNGAVFIGSSGVDLNTRATPTSTLDVNGSVSYAIRKIAQTGVTRALGLAAAARTVGATDRTVLVNTSVNPEGIEIILPNPVLASGREYVIRKMDDSSNPVLFSYPLSGAVAAVTAGGNAILVSEGTTNQFVGSMNFVKTLRIQSDGTNWVLID
ncbi:MAG: beta strand repeat-containing protein [Spirosomataceae bacterium]